MVNYTFGNYAIFANLQWTVQEFIIYKRNHTNITGEEYRCETV